MVTLNDVLSSLRLVLELQSSHRSVEENSLSLRQEKELSFSKRTKLRAEFVSVLLTQGLVNLVYHGSENGLQKVRVGTTVSRGLQPAVVKDANGLRRIDGTPGLLSDFAVDSVLG